VNNTPLDVNWDEIDFDDDGTAGGVADIPTPAELDAARKAREAQAAGNIAGIGPLTAGRKVDDSLLGIFFSRDADTLDRLESTSLEARGRLEDAIKKGYSDSIIKAFRQSYVEALSRQVGFQRFLERVYRSAGKFDFSLSDDSLLSPEEIKKVNAAPVRDSSGTAIGGYDAKYNLGRGIASSTLPKLRKRVAVADRINSKLSIPDGWNLESASSVLDDIQNSKSSRTSKNARMQARLAEAKNMFYGTILRKQGSPAIVRFQHSEDTIDATPAEMRKTVEAIKAVEDAGISLDALSATAVFNGRQSAEAGKKDPDAVAPFTIDVGNHERGAGFKDSSTIAYASSNGLVKLKLSKTRQYDSEDFRRSQQGHHAVEATSALDSVFNTLVHEIGHVVQYRAFSYSEFDQYKASGRGGRLNVIDGQDRVAGRYNEENGAEHWAEAFAEFIIRNKISPRMRQILITRGILLK
jgi:hypothetical protein